MTRASRTVPETSARQLIQLLLGMVLYVAGLALTVAVEGGDGEFSHLPFTTDPLPFSPMRGFTFEQLVAHGAALCLSAPGLWLVWRSLREGEPMKAPSAALLRRLTVGSAITSAALTTLVMLVVLQGRPIVDDELAYAFQAQLLSEGKLGFSEIPHAITEAFTLNTQVGATGKYLFGEPLIQVLGVMVGVPALLHPLLSLATLYCVHRALMFAVGERQASLAVILVALSPMYILTAATGMSQCTSLFCVALALYGHAQLVQHRALLGALCVAVGIGFGTLVRIQVGVPVGVVVVGASVARLVKARQLGALAALLGSLGCFAALLVAYNYLLTGSVLKLPWYFAPRIEHFGFGQVWADNNYRHTPLTALQNLGVVALRLNVWWLGWPCSWLLLWLWFKAGRPLQGARVWLAAGAALVLFEAGYYSTGVSDTGAIYHYELLLPLALLGAGALDKLLTETPRSGLTLLIVQFALGTSSFLFLQTSRLHRLVTHIHSEADLVMEALPDRSLLFWEPYCSEAVSRGWVHEKFPKRYRLDSDRVVTFPRPPVAELGSYLKRYSDRACFYFHIEPRSQRPELLPCRQATQYLARSASQLPRGARCLGIADTATRLGLFDPIESVKRRVVPIATPSTRNAKPRDE